MRRRLAAVAIAWSVFVAHAHAITGTHWVNDFEIRMSASPPSTSGNGEFVWRCSGSLIWPASSSPRATAPILAGPARCRRASGSSRTPGAPTTATKDPLTGYPNDCANGTLGTLCATSRELHNYGFDAFAGFPNTHDAGLVILDQPITMPEYGVLPRAGTLDSLGTARGRKNTVFTVSGYGLTLSVNPNSALSNISYRSRLMGNSTLVNLNSALNDGFNVQTQGNGNGRSGTCSGDSGGPVYLGASASNLIVAVTSFGLNAICRGTDFAYRIDREEVLEWIEAHRAIEERQ